MRVREVSRALSLVVSRLEELLAAAPKTGLKASMYLGVVSSLSRLAEDAATVARLAECIATANQACKQRGGLLHCSTGCASIEAAKTGGETLLWKYSSNAGSIRVAEGRVEINTEEAKLSIEPGKAEVSLPSGEGWVTIEVDLRSIDDSIGKAYFIKYAIRKVGKLLRTLQWDLRNCARARAITC
ncbi:hypothetical protein apy_05430 [Aeropyrum pernix]|uniref:Uncharacterized protein n=1 Tax=Aeropyrum pernix TaxID=56636 RepID=A0A401H8X2_AERPX|nr:hypothetical protein apy_05430 [Aeropyrum pernix]